MKLKPRYKIAEISIDEDGRYWFQYLGDHPEQGGWQFRYADGFAADIIEPALNTIKKECNKYKTKYLKMIQQQKEKDDV